MQRRTTTVVIAVTTALYAAASSARDVELKPADAKAKVPVTTYESALEGYKPFQVQEPDSWRDDNDGIGRMDGPADHVNDSSMQGAATETPGSEQKHINYWPSLTSAIEPSADEMTQPHEADEAQSPTRSTWGPVLERKTGDGNE
jgi:hypothetical protein